MKIEVFRLKEGKAETFNETLPVAGLDWGTDEVKYIDSINITTEARKEGNLLFTKTHLNATVQYYCARCLKECVNKIEKDFNIEYPLDKSNQLIDITADIRSEIIIDYPVKFLCKADCRGLCPNCGKDLNEEKCSCISTDKLK